MKSRLGESVQALQQSLRLHDDLIKHLWALQETYPQLALKAAQANVDNIHQALRERDQIVRYMEDEWTKRHRNQELYAGNGQTPTGSQ